MRKQTKLMSKLLGSEANAEFKNKVFAMMDEAHENGHSTLDEDGELLQFAEVNDDIIVEDQANGNELTRISENPDDENDFVLEQVEVKPEPAQEATKTESENLQSIEIERIPGVDGDKAEDIVPDLKVDIIPGIGTENKTPIEASYSMKFKNYSESRARRIAKLFSECVGCLEGVVKDANIDEDVQVKVSDKGEVKVMSVHMGKITKSFSENEEKLPETADLTEVIDAVNELAEKVDEGLSKEKAEEIKAECDKLMSKLTEMEESKSMKLYSLKSLVKRFSDENAEFMDKQEPAETEEEKAAREAAEAEAAAQAAKAAEDAAKAAEEAAAAAKAAEEAAKGNEEQKNESEKAISQKEDGKWYIEGDETAYESEEEAKEACKNFSDNGENEPKVTVTIENIEPASVSTLLAGPSGDEGKEEAEPSAETEPKVDPNFGEQGRQFSLNQGEQYDNPLLHTRW